MFIYNIRYSDCKKSLEKLQIIPTFLVLMGINVTAHCILFHMIKRFQLNSAFIDHLLYIELGI